MGAMYKWKKDADTVKLVDAFLKRTKSKHSAESITTDELLEHDARVNRDAIENVFGRVRPTQLANRAPIYFWIVDELSAVFSIPNFVGPDREQGFATSDPKLISALLKICQRMRKAT